MAFVRGFEDAIPLDAEGLAEGGMGAAYESVLPVLRQFVGDPARIEEDRDDDGPGSVVRCNGDEFLIHCPDDGMAESRSWGRATVALFAIVNGQLQGTPQRFYAINGGHDLWGIFLTPEELLAVQQSLPDKRDWPYLPRDEDPWYGQHHE